MTDNGRGAEKTPPLTLAADTSSQSAAAGLYRGTEPLAECFLCAGLTHSQTLGLMLEHLFTAARVSAKDVARVAVTNGPGSFTGLRIGVSTALGFALAAQCECAGVSSLEAAAWNAARGGEGALICAVQDARRGQVYTASFCVSGGGLTRLCEDHAAPAEDVARKHADRPVIYVGDGAEACYHKDKDILYPEWRHIRARGVMLCAEAGHTRPADRLCYLRLPQAERVRREQLAREPGA
ncbi:MAG: tRNA (adenosine(37)-N6)-threonylcarbamoyltransferase complex dimerization subunit type 1 TsaB [Oscillospiraceae bacterium]|nr:tRNA (adenosine(37)-N6)-threonylcarbamoyltransferase complex dimerization subunit type 1 TsaB [Oscillospiraceae bacterium]